MEETSHAAVFTYDVNQLEDGGINQMRFELGDTSVERGDKTCALCDQEYMSAIKQYPKSWKKAKYKCVCAIVAKLSYQVDYSAGGMSISLSQRLKEWQNMKESMKRSFQSPTASFMKNGDAGGDGQHYFRFGIHDNKGYNRGDR